MENELISVIVPIYNVERYLNRCLNSIVNQKYTNLEIILVDDGSPDNCPLICEEWRKKDSRIRVIHKKNAGLGFARNTGIENATGKYIIFVDSDDYIEENLVFEAYKKIKQYSADIVMFGLNTRNANGELISTLIPDVHKEIFKDDEILNYILPSMISYSPIDGKNIGLNMSASGSMFSMDLIKKHCWRFVSEREYISEDFYSLLDLYRYVKCFTVIEKGFYNYCENSNSLSRSYKNNRYQQICICYKKMLENSMNYGYPKVIEDALYSQFMGSVIASIKQIVDVDKSKEEKIQLIEEIISDDYFKFARDNMNKKNETNSRKIFYLVTKFNNPNLVFQIVKMKR